MGGRREVFVWREPLGRRGNIRLDSAGVDGKQRTYLTRDASFSDGISTGPGWSLFLDEASMRHKWITWWHRPAGGREVMWVALPLVISTCSWTVMHFIDRMFLVWHSQQELAAALPAAMVSFVVVCFFLGVAKRANEMQRDLVKEVRSNGRAQSDVRKKKS